MPIHVSPCVPSDGPALATLLTSTISGALRIELGKATPAALHQYLARYYPSFLERSAAANPVKEVCLKVVDDVDGMIAWAVWELPKEAGEEDQAVDDRTTPIYGMNVGFSIDLTRAGIKMRKSVLGGRKAFGEYYTY